jgi:hypothetical protein
MQTTHQPNLADLAQILFASPIQPLDHPTNTQIHSTISRALKTCGGDYSSYAGHVAQEAGDHPELYQQRMRWALTTIGKAYQPDIPGLVPLAA